MDTETFLHFSDSAVGLNLLEQLFFWLQQALGIVCCFVFFFSWLCYYPSSSWGKRRNLFAWSRELHFFFFKTPFEQCPLAGNFSSLHGRVEKLVGVERTEGWELGRRVGAWQRVRGLCSVSGQSRAFCFWELLLLPPSKNYDVSLPGMMLISQASRTGDACTGIALSFVSRHLGEREMESACQQASHPWSAIWPVTAGWALWFPGRSGDRRANGLFVSRSWWFGEGAEGLNCGLLWKNKTESEGFFLSFTLHGSYLNLEAMAPKFICKVCDRRSCISSLNNLLVQKSGLGLLSSIPSTRVF